MPNVLRSVGFSMDLRLPNGKFPRISQSNIWQHDYIEEGEEKHIDKYPDLRYHITRGYTGPIPFTPPWEYTTDE